MRLWRLWLRRLWLWLWWCLLMPWRMRSWCTLWLFWMMIILMLSYKHFLNLLFVTIIFHRNNLFLNNRIDWFNKKIFKFCWLIHRFNSLTHKIDSWKYYSHHLSLSYCSISPFVLHNLLYGLNGSHNLWQSIFLI